jgi:hypothetical protein
LESRLLEMLDDPGAAAFRALEVVQLGVAVVPGGGRMDYLNGVAIMLKGTGRLTNLVGQLDAASGRVVAARLNQALASLPPYAQAEARDRRLLARRGTLTARLRAPVARWLPAERKRRAAFRGRAEAGLAQLRQDAAFLAKRARTRDRQ